MSEKQKTGKTPAAEPKPADGAGAAHLGGPNVGRDAPGATPAAEIEELSDAELLGEAQQLAEQLAEEKEQLFGQHIRLQADFDNFRKRSRQEKDDVVKLATAALMQNLLPVLDNFERALAALTESNGREGVQMIHRQLLEALTAAGLTPIEAVGTDFDPQIHEAVLQTPAGEGQQGKVIGEAQKGYLLNGKLLRPSMVQVGC